MPNDILFLSNLTLCHYARATGDCYNAKERKFWS